MSLLQSKLEGDALLRKCELEIRTLHAIFVTWFRGEKPIADLRKDLQQRMASEFSHIAPNGHMVKGRDVLLQYLTDKYGCYQDRVFSIDVYNVELLWSSKQLCLASYEEWQSWDEDSSESSDNVEGGGGAGGGGGKQQFGRLSTCLLQRNQKEGKFQWIHVHETWMEAEEPAVKNKGNAAQSTIDQLKDDETVMTGPVPPSEIQHRFAATTVGPHTNTSLQNQHHPGMLRTNDDDNDSSDDDDEDEEPTESSSEAYVAVAPTTTGNSSNTPKVQKVIPTPSNKPPSSTEVRKEMEVSKAPDPVKEVDATKKVAAVIAATTTTAPVAAKKSEVQKEEKPARPEPTLTAAEQQFMENSQGILFFEDEDEPPVAASKKPNTMTLDDLMEADEDEISRDPSFLQQSKKSLSLQHAQLADEMNSSQAMLSLYSVADASHKRHVSPKLEQYAVPLKWEDTLVGVSIAGFDIGTSQGPIADSNWYAATTATLEESAQFSATSDDDDDNNNNNTDPKKRKIVLPEMVFPVAHVAMEGHGIWMSWDATDCLGSWANSHAFIPVNSTTISHNGVSVLQSKDAALWRDKRRPQEEKLHNDAAAVFHYDWTYSTPFAVKMEGGEWIELDESGMRMELLTDQAVPILFFDEIVLYEDDLHDNGQVKYSIKLRIMPTCAYILARLWVRVDHVMVRLRETRVLVDFFGIQPQVYRDVTWRECPWKDLAKHGLPTAVQVWSCESDGRNSGETAEWHNLVQQLPEVSLPEDFIQHAVLEYGM